jgi:hypothetical protein
MGEVRAPVDIYPKVAENAYGARSLPSLHAVARREKPNEAASIGIIGKQFA